MYKYCFIIAINNYINIYIRVCTSAYEIMSNTENLLIISVHLGTRGELLTNGNCYTCDRLTIMVILTKMTANVSLSFFYMLPIDICKEK